LEASVPPEIASSCWVEAAVPHMISCQSVSKNTKSATSVNAPLKGLVVLFKLIYWFLYAKANLAYRIQVSSSLKPSLVRVSINEVAHWSRLINSGDKPINFAVTEPLYSTLVLPSFAFLVVTNTTPPAALLP